MHDRVFPLLGLHKCCYLYTSLYRRACLVFFRIVYFVNLLCAILIDIVVCRLYSKQ